MSGVETAIIASSVIAAGTNAYTSIKNSAEQKKMFEESQKTQKEAQDAQLAAYKKSQEDYQNQQATAAAEQNRDTQLATKKKAQGGRQSTILTSPLGIPEETGANKTLLGR